MRLHVVVETHAPVSERLTQQDLSRVILARCLSWSLRCLVELSLMLLLYLGLIFKSILLRHILAEYVLGSVGRVGSLACLPFMRRATPAVRLHVACV